MEETRFAATIDGVKLKPNPTPVAVKLPKAVGDYKAGDSIDCYDVKPDFNDFGIVRLPEPKR